MDDLRLCELLAYRDFLDDPIISGLIDCQENPQNKTLPFEIATRLVEKAEALSLSGNLLKAYIVHLLLHHQNLVAQTMEASQGHLGQSLQQIFLHDLKILMPLLQKLPSTFLSTNFLDDYRPTNNHPSEPRAEIEKVLAADSSPEAIAKTLLSYYRNYGYGDIAKFKAFRWSKEKSLLGIEHFDPIRLQNIIGYETQKKQLLGNTLAFLSGKPANNVLLVGARGTGKSSTVKALINEYYDQRLRLVQVAKTQFVDLPLIMETLRKFASKKFIIFLDDLSFENFEVEYKCLKSVIEGGAETQPENVLIYATSNRRHLIKETWRDREDGQDELYKNDSINETISLSDRFGLVINYRTPNQDEYLAIIAHYLGLNGVTLTPEELRIAGHRWEIEHSGRSGRTARQFVDYYLGQQK